MRRYRFGPCTTCGADIGEPGIEMSDQDSAPGWIRQCDAVAAVEESQMREAAADQDRKDAAIEAAEKRGDTAGVNRCLAVLRALVKRQVDLGNRDVGIALAEAVGHLQGST